MGAVAFGKSSAAGAISGICSFGVVSSAFRISMAPVSISVAVLAGVMASAMLSSLVVVGATGCWSWRCNVLRSQQQLQQSGSIALTGTLFTGQLGLVGNLCGWCQPGHQHGSGGKWRLAILGPGLHMQGLAVGKGFATLDAARLRRLHHRKQASEQRQGFRIGSKVQSRCLAFWRETGPVPNASIVFISMPRSLPATGQNLCAKKEKPAGTLQKGCQSHLLCRDQPRRRGGIEASNRASRSSWRARSSASLRSTAREC